jgi:hypothetical protein
MATPQRIAELRAMLDRIRDAVTPEALIALQIEWIGHDEPDEDLRGTLRDYVAEICYAEGIHCSEVFNEGR